MGIEINAQSLQARNNTGAATTMYLNPWGGDVDVFGSLTVDGNITGANLTTSNWDTTVTKTGCIYSTGSHGDPVTISSTGNGILTHTAGGNEDTCWITLRAGATAGTTGSGNYGFQGSHIYGQTSDDRVKHHEEILTNSLSTIRQLVPMKYKKTSQLYAADYNGEVENYWYEAGLIAQDLLNINDLSWCVKGGDWTDNSGNNVEETYSVGYNNVLMYHIAATKELDTIVQAQQQEINDLKQENQTMKAALNTLLAAAGQPAI